MAKQYYDPSEIEFQPLTDHPNFVDRTGRKYGRLTAIGFAGKSRWFCRCECGNIIAAYVGNLTKAHTTSCGCAHRDILRSRGTDLRRNNPAEYRAYRAAKNRCRNPNCPNAKDYSLRGIEFRFNTFEEFLDDIGKRPSRTHSVERKLNDGHYEPGNVTWATKEEQGNNKRNNILLTHNGETMSIARWARKIKMDPRSLRDRIVRYGWCHSCAITKPRYGSCDHR